jgi:2-succinyl-5-enolpyruvyl-6-hydroxy-3-cyclohexene-1-carboxylate synthase
MIDQTNRNSALATALVEELARSGVRHAVLSPGSRSTPIALALDREEAVELTVVLDERCAGFVALGAAMATGTPAVVACTSGSAAANLHPAVVEADQAGVPLIVLTSDRPPELRGIGAGQTIDQIGLYGSAARWFCEVGTHEADDPGLLHMRSTGCRAFGEAASGRGPVHLNLSWRDPLGPAPRPDDVMAGDPLALEGRGDGRPLTVPIHPRNPSDELLEALAGAVERSERGLIVAGRQLDGSLADEILTLGAATGFPVLAEPTSQLRFASADPAVVAAYDSIARHRPARLEPDLILRFGDMPTSKPLRAWIESGGADQIVIDPSSRWNEPTRRAGAIIDAEGRRVAAGLAAQAEACDPAWRALWTEVEHRAQEAIERGLTGDSTLSEPAIHRELSAALSGGECLVIASSMPIRDAEAFMRPGERTRVFSNRGANGIDGTISTAAGIAAASRRPTWVVLGDLALAHDLGGLATIAGAEAPVRLLVIDNGGGGIFDMLPQANQIETEAFERLFTTPSGLDVERVAGLFDLPYVELTSPEDIPPLRERDRVLAHARVDRVANADLRRQLAAMVADALDV